MQLATVTAEHEETWGNQRRTQHSRSRSLAAICRRSHRGQQWRRRMAQVCAAQEAAKPAYYKR